MLAITEEDTQMMRSMIRENIVNLINNQPINPPSRQPGKTFLTQFNEKEEEEKQEVDALLNKKGPPHYDARKDKNAGTITEGLEQKLQRNILARYKKDDEVAKKDLGVKRRDFEHRINVCKEKQSKLTAKQEENEKVVRNFSQFINEKETVRKRAITKYQTELKIRLQKMIECDMLLEQLEQIKKEHQKHSTKVLKHKKFKDFLTRVIDLLPEDYLEAAESKYRSLMDRHTTLYESNLDLFESLISNSDKVKILRNEYERITIEHNANKMNINSKLAQLQVIREDLSMKNANLEEVLNRDGDKLRGKVIDLSNIHWGIDNMAKNCVKLKYGGNKPFESFTLDEKLESITEFIMKKSEIVKIVEENELKQPHMLSGSGSANNTNNFNSVNTSTAINS